MYVRIYGELLVNIIISITYQIRMKYCYISLTNYYQIQATHYYHLLILIYII